MATGGLDGTVRVFGAGDGKLVAALVMIHETTIIHLPQHITSLVAYFWP